MGLGAALRVPAEDDVPVSPHESVLERELARVDARVKPGVAFVRAFRRMPGAGTHTGSCEGSGVILNGGLIATTLSVAGPGDDITVRYSDGRTSPARVLRVDPIRELVILKPQNQGGVPMRIVSADSLHAGSWVFIVGFAFGAPEASLSTGRFSSRTSFNLTESATDVLELLQLEANVFPGNSGGAVIDARGHMIGLILGGLNAEGFLDPVVLSCVGGARGATAPIVTTQPPIGISFALPALDVSRLADDEERGSPRSYLGIRVASGPNPSGLKGVTIEDVVLESPAAQAGLRPGDLILGINGVRVPSPQDLAHVMTTLEPGSAAHLELASGSGESRRADLTVGDYTAEYRLRVVWSRLLSGRSGGLEGARARLQQNMSVVDHELQLVRALSRLKTR